ncbi:MAG: ABC-F family ATP-binding cassette domain-containing protein [Kiritimatiellae bacterium]|nr:ABC-F family ATP-binding cassette domain-containing protein [Kiritimatiellia bacterium]
MLDFKNISVHYGQQDVLSGVTFRVNKGDRIGVVGPNGSGKSTLFKIVLGEMATDTGELVIENDPRIGWTRQNPEPDTPEETLLEYSLKGIPGLSEMEARIHELEDLLYSGAAETASSQTLLKELGDLQTKFEHLGGYDMETRVKVALGGLGFSVEEFSKPFKSFSGGWRMRAELSRVLASKPDLLLLDEPSNYLDLPAVEWLQRYLKTYDGTLMLISHDRYLLRTLTSIIVEVDAGTATRYEGDLDYYLREREVRFEHLKAAKENQDRHREQLQRFVDRFRATASKAAQAQSRQKQIDKIDEVRIVLPKRYTQSGRLRLAPPPPSGMEMFRSEDIVFSYDGVRNVLNGISFNVTRGDKIALIGYNGLGKTTLMRILAGTRKPTSGKAILGHNVVPGYLSQEFAETIPPDVTVYRNAKNVWDAHGGGPEKQFRNQLGAFGFDENDVEKPAGVLSGGEKIRLAFLRLFLAAPNFLLLDEPTTHLDLDGRRLLQDALKKYPGTILLVSHDIDFVRAVATSVLEITPGDLRLYPGGYDYYCEKKAEAAASRPAAQADVRAAARPAAQDDAERKLTSKELRQMRAAERAKSAPRIKELKRKVECAEKKIDELQAALDESSAELFNPTPTTDFAEVNRKVRTLQFEIDRYTLEWEEAAEELEKMT